MAVAAVLLAVGVLWWRPWHQRGAPPVTASPVSASPSAASSDSATVSAADAATPMAAPPAPPSASQALASSSPPPGAAAANPATQSPPSEADATAGAGRAHLRLSFSADSWVDVHDAAGKRAFAGNGRANSVRTIDGLAPMRVYLGFASGVQLEINNRAVAIGPQFVAGDVARFEAGADGVLRRDSRNATASGPPTRIARPSN
jgi:cytoskeletal protein RodZ